MSEIKLKPCPFCGGEAIVYENDEYDEYMIGCKNCCAIEPMTEWASRENAIAQWNTRKPVERILERLEDKLMTAVDSANIYDTPFLDSVVEIYEGVIEIIKEEVG